MGGKSSALFVVIVGLASVWAPVFAHHGQAEFDTTSKVTVKGTVTKFLFANPHSEIFLDVKDDNGNVTHWVAETFSLGKLAHMGWANNSIKPGDHVSMTLNPAKDGQPHGYFLKLVFDNGKVLSTEEK